MFGKAIFPLVFSALALASCTSILGLDYDYRGGSTDTTSSVTTGPMGGAGGAVGTGGQTSTTSTNTGGAPLCGTYTFDALPSCQGCMEAKCCVELQGCTKGSPCGELLACRDECAPGDDVCKAACLAADEASHAGLGAAAYYALLDCNYGKCRVDGACQFPICTTTFTTYDRACSACAGNKCCNIVKNCSNSPTCLACLENPSIPSCATNAAYQNLVTCQTETCGKECAYSICGNPDFGYTASSCNHCLSHACCAQFDECTSSPTSTCYKCLSGAVTSGCESDAKFVAFDACMTQQCNVACSGI